MHRGSHPFVTEFSNGRPLKKRRIFHLRGLGTNVRFGVHNNSLRNLRRGLLERVYFVENANKELVKPPKPLPQAFDSLARFRKQLHFRIGPHSRISQQNFVDMYQGRKRVIYQQAADSLDSQPLVKKDSFLKTFIKAEKINLSKKPDPAPRVIQPRQPRYNVELGRFLKPLEHHIYRAVDDIWGGPTIIKGYSVEKIGSIIHDIWNEFTSPVAIGFDMKRFDQHVSEEALRWEHSVYLDAFSNDSTLRELLEWQIDNRGVGFASDGRIKYHTRGCRMSGDMNTALGNCLLACAITHSFVKDNKLKARLINNGDDCVLILEKERAEIVRKGLQKHWLKFGFQCELECDAEIIEKIEFCQMQPVLTEDGYIMVRDPRITLSKDCYSIGPWNSIRHAQEWVRAVGECGMALTGGIPVCQSFYQCFIRNTPGLSGKDVFRDTSFASGFRNLAKLGQRKWRPCLEETRYSFYLAFGITPDEQRALEADYDGHDIPWGFTAPVEPEDDISISWMLHEIWKRK